MPKRQKLRGRLSFAFNALALKQATDAVDRHRQYGRELAQSSLEGKPYPFSMTLQPFVAFERAHAAKARRTFCTHMTTMATMMRTIPWCW
uniref:Uncharacterized protein n=1 Tax=Ixodes scapularis TaxID=6945 RepID=A0A4D5RZA8_IXOSC